ESYAGQERPGRASKTSPDTGLVEAIPLFERALVLDLRSVQALAYLEVHWQPACSMIWRAHRLPTQPAGSEYVPWYGRIGHTYLVQSRIDESILWFERGHRANPASPLHHAWLAATYALKGDVKRAAF